MGDGEQGQFETSGNAGLVEDVRQMTFDSLLAERELFGDIAVAASFHDATNDFDLTRGEAVASVGRGSGLLHQFMES